MTATAKTREQAVEAARKAAKTAVKDGRTFDRADTVPVPQDIPAEHHQAYREAFLEAAGTPSQDQ